MMPGRRVCRHFAQTGSCKFKNCKFEHVSDKEKQGVQDDHQKGKKPRTDESSSSNSEEEFRRWRNNIPLDPKSARSLGSRLACFFQEAERLLKMDVNLMQDVIRCLSKEGGLKRVQELIEQEFHIMSTAEKASVFTTQILPFFRTISHPDVLASLVLEQSVGTIYNCVYGINGHRTIPLFSYILDVLKPVSKSEEMTVGYLERSLVIFSRILDINSTAFIQEPLRPVAEGFREVFIALYESQGEGHLYEAREYLKRIQRRLEIGSGLPTACPTAKMIQEKPDGTFVINKEPPGGRHDNDYADICSIKIMPTFQEIMCPRTEYLPAKDPTQWYVHGVDGLLDKNFRLLREDTIGQLRDAIQPELQKLLNPRAPRRESGKQHQLRTYIYNNAQLVDLSFDKFSGFFFEVRFPQPPHVVEMPANKRQEWWQISKRLQADALVCLADSQGCVTFCTTVRTEKMKKQPPEPGEQKRESDGLWKDKTTASVFLSLVEQDYENIQHVLNYSKGYALSTFSLVEFPGILLPAFQPTLLALQSMKRNGDLPFPEFLVPTGPDMNGSVDVPPPIYALKPGFSFTLRCLTNDHADLELKPGQPFAIDKLQANTSLDAAQTVALVNTLQRRIGLIQGPPGTGKSYTGMALIKVLLANRLRGGIGPLICVCYTNHALDQLLEDLLTSGITTQIIRIGSQSKSKKLEPFNLRVVARNMVKTRQERRTRAELGQRLDECEKDFNGLCPRLRATDSGVAIMIKNHLKRNHPPHHEELFGVNTEGFRRAGSNNPHVIIRNWLHSGRRSNDNPRPLEQLQMENIDQLSAAERKALRRHWVEGICDDLHTEAKRILSDFHSTKSEYDNIRDELDLRCLREAHVIGVTTTGLARNLNLLRRIRSKVLLCEEAGEVLEAHILTALLPSVEHAILIGDHLQLRPQIQNYELSRENLKGGEQYSLDVSLFERLVDPGNDTAIRLPYSTLEIQRRMHPSIAQLVRDTLYPQLKDSQDVFDHPDVLGILRRLFWLDHRRPEADSSNSDVMATSHWNEYEINMVGALVNHLIKQGTYKSGDIAILTPYLGQLHRLRRHLRSSFAIALSERDQFDLDKAGYDEDVAQTNMPIAKENLLKVLRVATIDNFQGEEAKVVVVSLVRSNKQNKCGFLRTSNRINVLLSRAKHGMYIIGNSATSSHVPMWSQVIGILQAFGNFDTSLQLQCPRHPNTPIEVSEPEHFVLFSPEGGCGLRCDNRLPCGHACVQKCHSELLHNAVYCLEPCVRPRKRCDHQCPEHCGDPCPAKCNVVVFKANRILPCGHLTPKLPCWQDQDLSTVRCQENVEKAVPGCKHRVSVHCCIDVAAPKYKCINQCRTNLPCGHTCKRLCWECVVHQSLTIINTDHGTCQQECGRKYSTCTHLCKAICHGENPCPPCDAPCEIHCGHSKCTKKCRESCTPCAEERCLSSCPHSTCSMPCAAPCDHIPCSKRCEKQLPCGHQCPSVCGESCPDSCFCHTCGSAEIKAHEVDFILSQLYSEINPDENPCIFPRCGHFLTMESMDAQMDIKKHYIVDANERPIKIATSSEPFSMDDIKMCATCRGSLRDVSRYGRLVRRALLDESTKKFILYLNRKYVPLAQDVPRYITSLSDKPDDAVAWIHNSGGPISIEGPRDGQVKVMRKLLKQLDKSRWGDLIRLRNRIVDYQQKVAKEEQPFDRVRSMVEIARKRKGATGSTFSFDEGILQTKGFLQATALLLRLDIALLIDFLSLRRKANSAKGTKSELTLNLRFNREDCDKLIENAAASRRIVEQVEGYIFSAQLYALERSHCVAPNLTHGFLLQGQTALTAARGLCAANRGQTKGLHEEIDAAEALLNGSTFYTAVTNGERLEVISAMAREFSGTGHWYYCENKHPFTVGECGMPMEAARCPECQAPVGGHNHQAVAGVSHANDLESLRNLRIEH